MKRLWILWLMWVALVGCAGENAVINEGVDGAGEENGAKAVTRLHTDYQDALSIQGQLALGTMQLEESELAVDPAQAATLLPLWQVLSTLGRSDTAATAEINGVVNQIQENMTSAQITAIAAMNLTAATVTELQDSGVLTAGRGQGSGAGSAGGAGIPGSGRGGSMGGGMGMGGGIPGMEADPNAQATRQAQAASSGANPAEQMLTNAVLRLLQTKTGAETENRAGAFEEMWQILSGATGLEVADLRTRMAAGETPAALIAVQGGDVTAVASQLVTALQGTPLAETENLEEYVDNLLYGSGN